MEGGRGGIKEELRKGKERGREREGEGIRKAGKTLIMW